MFKSSESIISKISEKNARKMKNYDAFKKEKLYWKFLPVQNYNFFDR